MDKNEWLVQSPRIFQESFTDLQHCCRICSALGCDSDLVRKFDQCAADQNQLAKQSSILAREVAYRWVPSCIKWYEQMRLKANVDEDVKMKLATQAEELSRAFFEISRRARACGGSLHDAQVTAQQKADYYYKKSREAAVEAERYERRMNEARKEAEEEMKTAREKSNTAENLRIAAWATILLPPVALGLATGASIVSSQSESAEERADAAGRASERARSSKWDAEFRQTKFQELSTQVQQAQKHLGVLEDMCNFAGGFLQSEADKFHSSATNFDSDQDLIEVGLFKEVAQEEIESLKLRGDAFQQYYQLMNSVGSSTTVRPHSYPAIQLPSFGLTLYN